MRQIHSNRTSNGQTRLKLWVLWLVQQLVPLCSAACSEEEGDLRCLLMVAIWVARECTVTEASATVLWAVPAAEVMAPWAALAVGGDKDIKE